MSGRNISTRFLPHDSCSVIFLFDVKTPTVTVINKLDKHTHTDRWRSASIEAELEDKIDENLGPGSNKEGLYRVQT